MNAVPKVLHFITSQYITNWLGICTADWPLKGCERENSKELFFKVKTDKLTGEIMEREKYDGHENKLVFFLSRDLIVNEEWGNQARECKND